MTGPIIVIGMHRSGTSMLTRVLERAGLFMGADQQRHGESRGFLRLNRRLLLQAGATWDDPEPFLQWLEHVGRGHAALAIQHELWGYTAARYLGSTGSAVRWDLHLLRRPWGWKDPRNTITLPVWLELFPNARIVHIVRHGLDVALSLLERERWTPVTRARAAVASTVGRQWPSVASKRAIPASLLDMRHRPSIERYMHLWAQHVRVGRRHVHRLGANAVEVSYEQFVAEPSNVVARLAGFAGLPITPELLKQATRDVHRRSVLAYRTLPDATGYEHEFAPMLRSAGYAAPASGTARERH